MVRSNQFMLFAFSLILIVYFLLTVVGCSKETEGQIPDDMIIHIPAGEFIMGTNSEEANNDRKPTHTVYVDEYYIDKCEVTNAQYEEFILAGGYQHKTFWTEVGWDFIQKNQISTPLKYGRNSVSTEPDQPVIGVSWYEANAYATWAGKRLPTEAEWEKAARGTDRRIYPWGNKMVFSKLKYFPHSAKLLTVGSFPAGASSYGVMDMAGSLWEWTADWYGATYYAQSPEKNPKGPDDGEYRVLRGGGWDSIRLQLQCTYRYYDKENRRTYNIGFRCAKDAQNR